MRPFTSSVACKPSVPYIAGEFRHTGGRKVGNPFALLGLSVVCAEDSWVAFVATVVTNSGLSIFRQKAPNSFLLRYRSIKEFGVRRLYSRPIGPDLSKVSLRDLGAVDAPLRCVSCFWERPYGTSLYERMFVALWPVAEISRVRVKA
jgi:hypothetical protein